MAEVSDFVTQLADEKQRECYQQQLDKEITEVTGKMVAFESEVSVAETNIQTSIAGIQVQTSEAAKPPPGADWHSELCSISTSHSANH